LSAPRLSFSRHFTAPPEPISGRSPLSLAQAIGALVEDLTIRKLSPATTKAYQADLVAVTRLLPPHDGVRVTVERKVG